MTAQFGEWHRLNGQLRAVQAAFDDYNDVPPPRDLEPVDRALYALAQVLCEGDPSRAYLLATLDRTWAECYGPLGAGLRDEIAGHLRAMYTELPGHMFVGPHEPGYWYFDDEHIEPPADVCFTCSNPETGLWVGITMCDMVNADDYDWALAADYRVLRAPKDA